MHKAFYPAVISLVAVGALVWLRPELVTPTHAVNEIPGAATARAGSGHLPTAGSAKPDMAQPSAAAATIRLSQVNKVQRTQEHEAGANSASNAEPKRPEAPPRKKETAANTSADSQQTPKSAQELLSVFVQDDPTQVFLPDSVRNHAAVQSEMVDPDWGPAASQAIRDYFAAKFGDRFEFPTIDCRQDLCELQAASRSGGNSDADMRDFQEAWFLMKKQPWWSALQFDQETGIVSTSPDGRALFIYFLSRK